MSDSTKSTCCSPDPLCDPIPYVRGLQQLVPPDLIQDILVRTKRKEKYHCRLPARAVVWLVIAMSLFANHSIPKAFRALHPSDDKPDPDDSTFTKARARLGILPMRLLFHALTQRLAPSDLPGVCYRDWRLVGMDGTLIDVPDTPDNDRAFGRGGNQRSPYAFPQLRLLALCELGTHQVLDFTYRPRCYGEQSMVPDLLPRLQAGMLLLWDRNFFSYELVQSVLKTDAQLLARVKATQLIFRHDKDLPDGSYLSKIYPSYHDRQKDQNGIEVRIIEYTHNDPNRPGYGVKNRLLTSILDPEKLPAREAVTLYHERWEEELVIDEFKTHMHEGKLLCRSKTPGGVGQELYGRMIAHRLVRQLMQEAAEQQGEDPDRLSFVNSLRVLQHQLPEGHSRTPEQWQQRVVREVGWQELRERRQRWYPRVIKRKMVKWDKKRPKHRHPPQPSMPFADAVVIT